MSENEQPIIEQAISILNDGGIIIFPTDTAFGIGCRIDKSQAVDKIFRVRNRPVTQALPVLVGSTDQALAYFKNPSDIVRRLMHDHWPGALTIVDLCKKDIVYSPICGGGNTIGLRWPKHDIVQKILDGVGVPIVGPSANIHGRNTPYRYEELDPELTRSVDLVVPGACTIGNVSTVVDVSVLPYKIIRQGAVEL